METRLDHRRSACSNFINKVRSRPAEQRIKELEQQLQLMSQKAQFFEAVVEVLKNDYGVSIVKKRPGKSSRSGRSKG